VDKLLLLISSGFNSSLTKVALAPLLKDIKGSTQSLTVADILKADNTEHADADISEELRKKRNNARATLRQTQ